ncbi:hypothetical protein GQ457_04G012090 [Hibiscus cannabinus]
MERGKSSVSDEDEPNFTEECVDGHNDGTKGKKGSPWQRVKWTDKMVRLLITEVSYIEEDESGDCGGGRMRRKFLVLQNKGKWKPRSLQLALRSRDDDENKARRHQNADLDDDDHDLETNDHDELEENHASHGNNMICGALEGSTKRSRQTQLEEQKLQIHAELLQLEKQHFKWQRFSEKRDHELEKMIMENERMKLENERMALELKRNELSAD